MDRQAHKICECEIRVGEKFGILRRWFAEDFWNIEIVILEHRIGSGDRAKIAARARERCPGSRSILARGGEHIEAWLGRARRPAWIKERIRSVGGRNARID